MMPHWPTRLLPFKRNIQLCLAVFVGVLCTAVGGTCLSFMVYSNSFKKTFGLTQTQTELNMALMYVGSCTCFPAGYLMERIGPSWTLAVGAGGAGTSYFLLWGSVNNSEWYSTVPALVSVYCLLAGLGSSFAYITPLSVCYKNFHPSHKGTVNSIVEMGQALGTAIVSIIYQTCFVNGHLTDEENQNLAGFFMMLAVMSVATGIAGYFFVRVYSPEGTDEGPSSMNDDKNEMTETFCTTGLRMLKNVAFHQFAWGIILSISTSATFLINLAAYAKSFKQEHYILPLTIVGNLSMVFVKVLAGFVSDWLLKHYNVPRILQVMAWNGLQAVSLLLCIFYADNIAVFFTAFILVSGSIGVNYTLGVSIQSDYFGEKSVGRSYGCIIFWMGVVTFLELTINGVIYSKFEIPNPETTTDCYGLHCFRWSYVFMFILSFLSFILNILSLRRDYAERKKSNEQGNIDRNYIRLE